MNSLITSLVNWKAQDESRFELMMSQGPFEVRLYPRLLCARVSLNGNFEETIKSGMKHISDYLEGTNFKVKKILHAGPCFHMQRAELWDVGMILPSHLDIHSVPKPINRLIRIEEWSPATVGVLRFRGVLGSDVLERKGTELKRWIQKKGFQSFGVPRVFRHDFMIQIPFFRPNEVHLDLL